MSGRPVCLLTRCEACVLLLQTLVTKMPCGDAVLSVRNINPTDENSVLHNYYQHDGRATLRQHVLNELMLVRHTHTLTRDHRVTYVRVWTADMELGHMLM